MQAVTVLSLVEQNPALGPGVGIVPPRLANIINTGAIQTRADAA